MEHDTIVAVATAPGRAGIGVVRLSGPRVATMALQVTGRSLAPRRATVTAFRDSDGVPIDEGIALFYPQPQSYTGEDVLELQGHGGPVVLQLVVRRCLELGARLARPGEFTERAFLNGKLDLAQAESVVDLIESSTAQAARSAMRSLQGDFSAAVREIDAGIVHLRAHVEATLDFPEEDVDAADAAMISHELGALQNSVERLLTAARQGALLRSGIQVVFAGQPNVGKSSLLNRLAGEEVAIVTEVPGTTRDALRQTIDVDGVPVQLVDTAGLRDASDIVERIGVSRAWQTIGAADAVLLVLDSSAGVTSEDEQIVSAVPADIPCIRVMNKIDLLGLKAKLEQTATGHVVWVSAKSGAGLDLLRRAMLDVAGWQNPGETVYLARARHTDALRQTVTHLVAAGNEVGRLELLAEELRLAHERLGAVTGEFTSDDLLGEIFSRFCIGK